MRFYSVNQVDSYTLAFIHKVATSTPPSSRWGHSTRDMLAEMGYSEAEVGSMIDRNIASLGWTKEFFCPADDVV